MVAIIAMARSPAKPIAGAGRCERLDEEKATPPDGDSRSGPRPGRKGGRYEFARGVLASDRGKALYGRRQGSVESVFGQIKANRGFRGFQRRGRLAVRSEWRLAMATHNLLKLHQHRLAIA